MLLALLCCMIMLHDYGALFCCIVMSHDYVELLCSIIMLRDYVAWFCCMILPHRRANASRGGTRISFHKGWVCTPVPFSAAGAKPLVYVLVLFIFLFCFFS